MILFVLLALVIGFACGAAFATKCFERSLISGKAKSVIDKVEWERDAAIALYRGR